MEYPLNGKGNPNGPLPYRCSGCGTETGANFITLNGGILPSEDKSNFLAITSHHEDYRGLELVSSGESYQYEFYFCGAKCLRTFLNAMVDDLEKSHRK